jgi:hypothetical protein
VVPHDDTIQHLQQLLNSVFACKTACSVTQAESVIISDALHGCYLPVAQIHKLRIGERISSIVAFMILDLIQFGFQPQDK